MVKTQAGEQGKGHTRKPAHGMTPVRSRGKAYGRSSGITETGSPGKAPARSRGKTYDRSPENTQERKPGKAPARSHDRTRGMTSRNTQAGKPVKRTGKPRSAPAVSEPIRLNRYIANSGLCARREADELIKMGYITVNGVKVTDMGIKVKLSDSVEYKGRKLKPEHKIYILLNKPKGYVTTVKDPHAEATVIDLVKDAAGERIYPVGRLDKSTTGVLLLTNDGDLAGKLTHPRYGARKVYHVFTDRDVTRHDMETIIDGVKLDDETVSADAISYVDPEDRTQVGIEIHSGQNRVVRRIFEKLGYRVRKLDRVSFAGLTKKNLPRGTWRHLTSKELSMLKRGIFK